MSTLFAGAKADVVREDESTEEAWEWVTGMFKDPSPQGSKRFTPGGFPMNLAKKQDDPLTPGYCDVYKGSSARGTHVTIRIFKCVPYTEFGYTEEYEGSSPSIMYFKLNTTATGTHIEIQRAEKQVHSLKSRLSSALLGGFNKDTAVGRLAFILTGTFAKGSSFEDANYSIVRDDTLKKLFGI